MCIPTYSKTSNVYMFAHTAVCLDAGHLTNDQFVTKMMTTILRSVLGAQRLRLSPEEKAFYSTLLTWGGPLVMKFVSANLLGPSESTIRRFRSNLFSFSVSDWAQNVPQVTCHSQKFT